MKVEIPSEWAKIEIKAEKDTRDIPEFIKNVVEPSWLKKEMIFR